MLNLPYRNIHALLKAKTPKEVHGYYGKVECADAAILLGELT
jgi:hypothetical protein